MDQTESDKPVTTVLPWPYYKHLIVDDPFLTIHRVDMDDGIHPARRYDNILEVGRVSYATFTTLKRPLPLNGLVLVCVKDGIAKNASNE